MGKILFILAAIFVGCWLIVLIRHKPEKSEAPLLPENYDAASNQGTYGAASYYASAMHGNRYDLIVAAAGLPPDDWPRYLDTMAQLYGRSEEIIAQCVAAMNEKFKSAPYRAVDEDVHALLGLARQFAYARLMSDAAAIGIQIEESILRWFEPRLSDLPAGAASRFSRILKEHWDFCGREGSISGTMPVALEGCIIAEPRWKEVAAMEESLLETRRSMRSTLVRTGYGEIAETRAE